MNQNMNTGCGCQGGCPPLDPIVMPCRTCTVTRCFPIEQPVICPSHTHVINKYVPVNRYYYQHTTDQETQCPGSQTNTNIGVNNNNLGM